MNEQQEIREQQKASWKKWDEVTMDFLHPVRMEIIRILCVDGNANVLDIASGKEETGLTIASSKRKEGVR